MPTYDYRCTKCERLKEEVRLMADRSDPGLCYCGGVTERVMIASPTMTPWNPERRFPNLAGGKGDGSMAFPTRAAYEGYLKENGIGELGIRAPLVRPHGNKVIGVWNNSGKRLQ